MLCLGQKIDRHPVGIVAGVGDHQNFGGAGDHVDADLAEDPPLGRRHPGVAGSGDLVHRRDALGAPGKRGDGLGAADAPDLVDAGEAGGQQHQRVHLALRCRHRHGQTLHPGDAGRYRVHQHRGGVGGKPSRHVEPGCVNRRPAPAEKRTALVFPAGVLGQLAGVVGAYAFGGQLERRAFGCRHTGDMCVDLLLGEAQPGLGGVESVEAAGVVDEGGVAPPAHLVDDGGDIGIDIGIALALGGKKGAEGVLESGIPGGEKTGHQRVSPSSSGWVGALPEGAG